MGFGRRSGTAIGTVLLLGIGWDICRNDQYDVRQFLAGASMFNL